MCCIIVQTNNLMWKIVALCAIPLQLQSLFINTTCHVANMLITIDFNVDV